MRILFLVFTIAASIAGVPYESVLPIVRRSCLGCHTGTGGKGGVNLAGPSIPPSVWHKAGQVVEAGQMPPHGAPQPTASDREALVAWIGETLADDRYRQPGPRLMRRLTRLEYNNTVRDLLELDRDLFQFPERLPYTKTYFQPGTGSLGRQLTVEGIEYGQKIPVLLRYGSLLADNRAEYGFTNRADALNISPLLMEKYMAVASAIALSPELERYSGTARALLQPTGGRTPREVARKRLAELAGRAYRRPPAENEIDALLRPFDMATARGQSFPEALRGSLRTLLASPGLIYLNEPRVASGGKERRLNSWEVASRLSYFLWATTPDRELRALAQEDLLGDEAVLEAQVRRMLRDPKVRELSESFAYQWLQLNEMLGARPDLEVFPKFYKNDAFGTNKFNLGTDMLTEALLLIETTLVEDRSILDFLDARYTWVNQNLMKHYGLEKQFEKELKNGARQFGASLGSRWFRAQLPDRTRGGILGLGATLTMTSTPLRTSPVFRGAWALEVLFNRPPPPPPNVATPPLGGDSPTDTAAAPVRKRVEEHRRNPACASCHNRMDPIGFALENYDGIGGWRTADGPHPVDPSGTLSHGRTFTGIDTFKDALLERREDFVRGFVEHMMSYALGRKIEYYDAPAVNHIVHAARKDDYRFSRIVVEIARSYPFRNVRNEE